MAYKDMREFIARLEEVGELRTIKQEVDWKYEVGAWLRHSADMRPPGPALLFENLKGYPSGYRIFGEGLGTPKRFAIALGLEPEIPIKELINVLKERMRNPVKPKLVETGPVKEEIHKGEDVNLLEFPVPWWTPRDGGRYIGVWHGTLTKDAVTGVRNLGMYRVEIQGKDRCTVGFLPYSHLGHHFAQRRDAGQPMEIAIVIGADETIPIVSATGVPESVDEYDVAGGLRGAPIELVKCETVDLEVPANAEMVLEGILHTDSTKRLPEGPFGEHTGYHGGAIRMRPIFEVKCIMNRHSPIYRGALLGKPVTEPAIVLQITRGAEGLRMFEEMGPPGVKAINALPQTGGMLGTVIQMRPEYVGHARDVGRIWVSSRAGTASIMVVIVDEDIDPFDLGQVCWAMSSRVQGSRDIETLRYRHQSRSTPSIPKTQGEYSDVFIVDATKKLDYPYVEAYQGHWAPVGMPPRALLELVDLKWQKEIGGREVSDKEIEDRAMEIEQVLHKRWEDWRAKQYVITEEEKEKEIELSYPSLHGGLE